MVIIQTDNSGDNTNRFASLGSFLDSPQKNKYSLCVYSDVF